MKIKFIIYGVIILKGTDSVILNNLPFEEENIPDSQRYPLNLLLIIKDKELFVLYL